MSGLDLITAAHRRLVEAEPLQPTAEQLFAQSAALVAKGLDLLKQPSPANAPSFIDPLAAPQIILVGADGKPLVSGDPVAFVLPLYRRMFTIAVQKSKNWEDAKSVAAATRTLGYEDWRLPADKELELLICRSAAGAPYTYQPLAKHTPTGDIYWTSSPVPSASSCAFCVYFYDGSVGWGSRHYAGLVRACREVPPRQYSDFGIKA